MTPPTSCQKQFVVQTDPGTYVQRVRTEVRSVPAVSNTVSEKWNDDLSILRHLVLPSFTLRIQNAHDIVILTLCTTDTLSHTVAFISTLFTYLNSLITAVRLSTGQTTPAIIWSSVFKLAVNSDFASRAFSTAVPQALVWNSLEPSVCSLTRLFQILLKDHTVLCHLSHIARFTAKQRLRFARDLGHYTNLYRIVLMTSHSSLFLYYIFALWFLLWPAYIIGQAIYIFILSFLLSSSFFLRLISVVGYWMSTTHGVALVQI